ncbi:MAG TPA: SIS domain-containing protein, partial [Chitinophagales bacterium]|nr:SIS domain-containing protein [Chitinophagales bacterium]
QLLYILHHLSLLEDGFKKYLQAAIELLDADENEIKTQAKEMASKLNGKIPVIYSDAKFEGVSIRFRQQINENSK